MVAAVLVVAAHAAPLVVGLSPAAVPLVVAVSTELTARNGLLVRDRAAFDVDDVLGEAEFALAVGDAWQGQGLGRALVQRLAAHARAEGLAMLVGTVMPGNEPMLHLMQVLGAEVRSDASEVQVRLPL